MFDRRFNQGQAPQAAVAGAHVGQGNGACYPSGFQYPSSTQVPNRSMPCEPKTERRTLLGIDSTPAPQASPPQGNTNTVTTVVGTPAAFAFSITPFCSAIGTRLLLPPEVADEVDITSIQVAGLELLGGSGQVPGRAFVEIGDNCCPLVQTVAATSSTPFIVRGLTRGTVASLTLRAAILADVATP